MKLTTSFVSPRHDSAAVVALVLTCGALLLLGAAVVAAVDAYGLRSKTTGIEARIAELRSVARGTAEPARQAVHDLAEVRDRVRRINGMVGLRGISTLSLLETFERLLPDPAYVVNLQHRAEVGEIVLLVAADSVTPLTAFLRALEREPRFQQVLLLRQSAAGSKRAGGVQFEIRIKERV